MLNALFLIAALLFPAVAVAVEAPAEVKIISPQEFREFTCYRNFFTVTIPADWEAHEDNAAADAEKAYGVELKGPVSKEGVASRISVIYYGPDHLKFKGPEDFIKTKIKLTIGEEPPAVHPFQVAGYPATRIERHPVLTLSVLVERVPMVEQFSVVPAKQGGFYVITYVVPERISYKSEDAISLVFATFRPNM
jgi:hypothetical protein